MGVGLRLIVTAVIVAIAALSFGAFDNAQFGWEVPSVTDVRFKTPFTSLLLTNYVFPS